MTMPEIAHWTTWIIWLFFPLVIGYELYARNNAAPGSSLGDVFNQQLRRHPILGVLLGVLIGHLAWQQTVYIQQSAPQSPTALQTER